MKLNIHHSNPTEYFINANSLEDVISGVGEIIDNLVNDNHGIDSNTIMYISVIEHMEYNPIFIRHNDRYIIPFKLFARTYGTAEMIQNYNRIWLELAHLDIL